MRINLVVEIKDSPGQLVEILNPIKGLGANIVTVIHRRDEKNEEGNVPVQLTLEGSKDNIQKVIDRIKNSGFSILKIDNTVQKEYLSAILIGHIIDNDIRDMMDQINAMNGVFVSTFEIELNGEAESSALIRIEINDSSKDLVYNKLKEIAESKDLLIVSEV